VRRQCIMKQMSFWCGDLKETSIIPVFYFESGRTRTRKPDRYERSIRVGLVDFLGVLSEFGRACRALARPFLV
jgi:hypothetical protein